MSNMKIVKFWSSNALLFVLITAFITMQWSTSHIHLAEQHSHQGNHHQHQIQAHAHHLSLTEQHPAAIDFSHDQSHTNIIDVDHEYSFSKREKQKKPSTIIITSIFPSLQSTLPNRIKIPTSINNQLSYLTNSSLKIRAPPSLA